MADGNLSRRAVVAIAGATPLLAACTAKAAEHAGPVVSASPTSPTPTHAARPVTHDATPAHATPALVATSQVPVGGAVVLADQSLVVTQPVAGEFRCFSSLCTHAGCPVRAGSPLVCPCHGSEFAIADGAVVRGPATRPLPAKKITVVAGGVHLA